MRQRVDQKSDFIGLSQYV